MRKKNDPTGKPPKSQAETRRERLEASALQYSERGKRLIATALVLASRLPTSDLMSAKDAQDMDLIAKHFVPAVWQSVHSVLKARSRSLPPGWRVIDGGVSKEEMSSQ